MIQVLGEIIYDGHLRSAEETHSEKSRVDPKIQIIFKTNLV